MFCHHPVLDITCSDGGFLLYRQNLNQLMQRTKLFIIFLIFSIGCPVSLFSQFKVEVPYTEENGKLIVEAKINGCNGHFIVDTGAPCALSHSFIERAGKAKGQEATFQDANGNIMNSQVITLDYLKLGAIEFTGLQAVVLPANNIIETFHIDGVIGYNLFRMGCIRLNGKKHTLTFSSKPMVEAADSVYSTPLVKDRYLTLLPVTLGKNVKDTVMFDSGASDYYTMSVHQYPRIKHAKARLKVLGSGSGTLSAGAAGVEQSTKKYRLCVPQFSLCQNSFKDVTTITTSAPSSRIGTGFLTFGDIAIDYKKGLFYFIPYEANKVPNLYQPEWDVVIVVSQNKLVAGMVWDTKHSPLRGGEQIVEINGVSYAGDVDMYKAITKGVIPASTNKLSIKYIDPNTGETRSTVIRCK